MKTTKKIAYEWEHGKVTASWDSSQKDALVYLAYKRDGVRQNDRDMALSTVDVRSLKELLCVVLGAIDGEPSVLPSEGGSK